LHEQQSCHLLGGGFFGGVERAGGLVGLMGGGPSTDDFYAALARNREVLDIVIDKNNLKEVYDVGTYHEARLELVANTTISQDRKAGFLTLATEDEDPKRAADIANSYFDALLDVGSRVAATTARAKVESSQNESDRISKLIASSEYKLSQEIQSGGIGSATQKALSALEASSGLRAQLISKTAKLRALEMFYTSRHAETLILSREIEALQSQLDKIENGGAFKSAASTAGGANSIKSIEIQGLYKALEMAVQQVEFHKVKMAHKPALLQIDAAKPPEVPEKPNRPALMVGVIFLAIVSSVTLVTVREWGVRRDKHKRAM